MDYFEKLAEMRELIKTEKANALRRLEELDWEAEFKEAQEDEEYDIIKPYSPELKEFEELRTEIRNTLNSDTTELCEYLAETERQYLDIFQSQFAILKQEYMKRKDEDYMPFLVCENCFKFFTKESERKEHQDKCEGKKTTCGNCGKNCRTQERLEAHIEASVCIKKYKCDKCSTFAPTNSEAGWYRHLKSKEHKQNCGIVKEEVYYPCNECDITPFSFPSELKRHKRTHLKKK